MSNDEANVTETPTDDTNGGETTEETTTQEQEGSETNQEETTTEGEVAVTEESAEFVPYDFAKDVKLPENYDLPETAQAALNLLGKEHGIKADKVQGLVDQFISVNESIETVKHEAAVKKYEQGQVETKDALLKDWGDNFEKNQVSVNKVLEVFFSGSFDHMFGEVKEGETRDLNTRDVMPVHFEKALLEISKKISSDHLEVGDRATGINKGLKDKFADLNKQYKT